MAFNIFATATSDIPLANLDANFTMIGSSAVASTLYPTATTSITYGTAGTIHYFSGSGLAVTGTLSSTLDATIYGVTVGRGGGSISNSTAVGYQAGYNNTNGNFTAVGYRALYTNTTYASNNSAFGDSCLYLNTTGSSNTAVGALALYSNTTASNNTAVGYQASYSNVAGAGIVAIGRQALYTSTGSENTAVGDIALYGNTTGSYNVALGRYALFSNTTASNNTAVGYQAGYNSVTNRNTYVGYQAGYGNGALHTTEANTAIGHNAGYGLTTGSNNTFVGGRSDSGTNTGAGFTTSTGSYNNFFGGSAGGSVTSGSKNTIIGNYDGAAAPISATGSNYVVLSDGDGNVRGTFDSSGNLGIGTTSPYKSLTVGATDAAAWITAGGPNTNLTISSVGANGSVLFRTGGTISDPSTTTERARIDSSGNLLVGATSGSVHKIYKTGTSEGDSCLAMGAASGNIVEIYDARGSSSSAAATVINIPKNSSTNRSINAGGTINASGADYAEYMTKAGDFAIVKGDVIGIDAQGKLTNVFTDAVSFVVKSTDPSYVGGDSWGNEDAVGKIPTKPVQIAATDDVEAETDEAFAVRMAQYETDKTAFDAALEAARQKVDRIAFAGQVPVNVTGATAGQYIIPVNNNGAIKGEAVSNPTFEQYQISVGKVIAIDADGRAKIIVKVA
jgi:hypothetical protein